MLDLLMGIDRRMKYLEDALPMKPSTLPTMTKEQRAEMTTNLLPILAYRCSSEYRSGPQSKSEDEIVCETPSGPRLGLLSDRERLLRLLHLLNIGEQRMLEAKGQKGPAGPFVYVFSGKKVYRQDPTGNRVLQVDGDRVKMEVNFGSNKGGLPKWFVDSVEVDRNGRVVRSAPEASKPRP
jgi:hypothetical protein